ncbi:hypothetical protein ABT160_16710 [Streptomyces sp. NPDC001941]|uniref:hypothetical protein n=1 Tax=Streptomyces sp. NPDC001941 TaxID=3154659 RepID=UPI00332FD4FD
MTNRPGVDYPVRTTYQPDEPVLEMTVDQLHDLRAAVLELDAAHAGEVPPGHYSYPDFVICPG